MGRFGNAGTTKKIFRGIPSLFAEGGTCQTPPRLLAAMDDKIEWTEAEGFRSHAPYVGPQAVVGRAVFMRLA